MPNYHITRAAMDAMTDPKRGSLRWIRKRSATAWRENRTSTHLIAEMEHLVRLLPDADQVGKPEEAAAIKRKMARWCNEPDHFYRILRHPDGALTIFVCVYREEADEVVVKTVLFWDARAARIFAGRETMAGAA